MTKFEIAERMMTNLNWLERGVLAIDARQTSDELVSCETRHVRCHGWNKGDARYGSYVAKYLRTGRRLSGHHIAKTQRMMMKYAGQLARIASPTVQVVTPTVPAITYSPAELVCGE